MGGIYKLAKSSYGKRRFSFTTATSGQGDLPRTFHGNGPTDMARILKVYSDGGFRGAMRPDHAPTLEGEGNDRPGYAMGGKVFAIGYMKGIMDAMKIAYE